MLWLWMTLAWGGAPESVDLEALDRWENGVDRLLDGPSGCWEVVGKATWSWNFGRLGESSGGAAFVGVLREGVWSELHVEALGESRRGRGRDATTDRVYEDVVRFAPVLGRVDPEKFGRPSDRRSGMEGRGGGPGNLLRTTLDGLGGEAETSYAQWDLERKGVMYTRFVPIGKGGDAKDTEMSVFFPDGQALPVSLDVVFPERFRRGGIPSATISDAVVELRGKVQGDQLYPIAEAVRFNVSVLGFRFNAGQTIRYLQFAPCKPAEASSNVIVVESAPAS